MKKLPYSFYRQADVVSVARLLIGKHLYSRIDGILTGGIIAETEAYAGVTDRASHAYNGRRTERTKTMYLPGGFSYVYFTYGMHHLFNVVTNEKDIPHAVLIRGILPVEGIDIQKKRRHNPKDSKQLANGPAKVCQALGITREHNALDLTGDIVWIADDENNGYETLPIRVAERVGVEYAGADARLPYRFILDTPDYSPAKPLRKKP